MSLVFYQGGVTLDLLEKRVDLTHYFTSIAISLVMGFFGFLAAYKIFDWITPEIHFGRQLRDGNVAVAIFLAGLFVGIGLLLGSAVK